MPIPKTLTPAAAATLRAWHDMVERDDMSGLARIIHPAAIFRSPIAFKPYAPAVAVILALTTANEAFENFSYHRELGSDDGRSAILEFTTTINGKELRGVDIITFDEAGLITEFEVAARPLGAIQVLADEMGRRIGAKMQQHSAG